MQDLKKIILDVVNLESYSSSFGFIGYFERGGRYETGMAETAVACFIDMIKSEYREWMLVSALHANDDEVGHFGDVKTDLRDLKQVEFLSAKNALRHFSYKACFGTDYESHSYTESIKNALTNFCVVSIDSLSSEVLEQLLVARMTVYGLRGHCFLISEQKGLILYPHDDTGFGVIAFGEKPRIDVAIEFLDRADRLDKFKAVKCNEFRQGRKA